MQRLAKPSSRKRRAGSIPAPSARRLAARVRRWYRRARQALHRCGACPCICSREFEEFQRSPVGQRIAEIAKEAHDA